MLIYVVVFLLLFLPIILFKGKQDSKKNNSYYIFEFILLFLFAGLRYRVGGDSIRYEDYYANQSNLDTLLRTDNWWTLGFQPGWTLLMAVCKSITSNFVIVQLVQSFILNISIFILADRKCTHRYTFILLYFFAQYLYFDTEILREAIAVAFFMLGYDYLVRRMYFKYLGVCLLCFSFHASAAILFLLPFFYPLLSKLRGVNIYISAAVIGVFMGLFSSYIFNLFINHLFSYNFLLQEKINDVVSSGNLNIFGIISALIELSPLLITIYLLNKDGIVISEFDSNNFILSMLLITSILGIVYVPLNRLTNYFTIYFLMILTNVSHNRFLFLKYSDIIKVTVIILIITKISWYMDPVVSENGNPTDFRKFQRWIPYSSILEPYMDGEREKSISNEM